METPKNLLGNQPIKQLPKQINNGNLKLPTETSNLRKKVVIIFIVVLLIAAVAIWFTLFKNKNKESLENTADISTSETVSNGDLDNSALAVSKRVVAEPVSVSGSNAVVANDQKAGGKVEVTMITLSVPGWVAIHEDRNGSLGNVLGASRFDPGIHLGEVELLRGTVSGGTYHAVLYRDNGDKQFAMSTDAPIKNAEEKIIEAIFKAE